MAHHMTLRVIAGSQANDYDVLPRLISYTTDASFTPTWLTCILLPSLRDDWLGQWGWERCCNLIAECYGRTTPLSVRMRTMQVSHWRWESVAIGIPFQVFSKVPTWRTETSMTVDAPHSIELTLTLVR